MTTTKQQLEAFGQLLEDFRTDIPLFSHVMFGFDLRPKQIEFAEAFMKNDRITFKGGVGFGKTAVMAVCIWWALFCCKGDTKVSIFGPTQSNLENGIWNEVELFYNKLDPVFQDMWDFTATACERKENGAACWARWRTIPVDKIGSIAGLHAENNFIFVDEAADVPDIAFEKALQNHLTTDINPKLILVSNPRRAAGFFYDTWEGDISKQWTKVHGRMQDSPRVTEEHLEYAALQYKGKGSNDYIINVEGDFPTDSEEGLIPASLIEYAVENKAAGLPSPSRPKVWGVDPAGPGRDRTVVVKRHDNYIYENPIEYRGLNIVQLSYKIRDMYVALPHSERQNLIIAVDANGLGRGLYDNLVHFGLPVHKVTTQSSPTKIRSAKEQFAKLRDQLWWQVREWFETEDVSIPYNKDLIKELKSPTWGYDKGGKTKVEGKDEMKKRLKVSPDYADALCLTFAPDEKRYIGKYSWNQPVGGTNHSAYE